MCGVSMFVGIHVFQYIKAYEFSNFGLLGVLFFLIFKISFQTLFPQISLQCSDSLSFHSGICVVCNTASIPVFVDEFLGSLGAFPLCSMERHWNKTQIS